MQNLRGRFILKSPIPPVRAYFQSNADSTSPTAPLPSSLHPKPYTPTSHYPTPPPAPRQEPPTTCDVDDISKSESDSNFRSAVSIRRRTFSTLKHCVRKKILFIDGDSSSGADSSGVSARNAYRPMFRRYYDSKLGRLSCPRCQMTFKDGIKVTVWISSTSL